MAVVPLVKGIMNLINKNIIARTNLITDATAGQVTIGVANSFHFEPDQEIVIIDNQYNVDGAPHYQIYEYAQVKTINSTTSITLSTPIISNWLVSDNAFIQKTIGHSPLYEDKIYYGDREVIPTEDMAITVEPVTLSNEWIYLMGGLSEEYRVKIMIYGKNVETEQGMEVLNMYGDAVYDLLNDNIHIDVDNYESPLLVNASAGDTFVIVQDTVQNRQKFIPYNSLSEARQQYGIQDNNNVECDLYCNSVTIVGDGTLRIGINKIYAAKWGVSPYILNNYKVSDYAVLIRYGRYFYDTRADQIEYGLVQKGSAVLRAGSCNWFGKEVREHKFPQKSKGVEPFELVTWSSSSSSGSSSS